MPDNNVNKLYMAKNLEDLNKLIDVKLETKPEATKMCKSAVRMYKSAEEKRKEGDEEKSYVLYMRFMEACIHIRAQSAYNKDRQYFDGMIGMDSMRSASNWATKLSSSLEKRYKMLNEEEDFSKRYQQKALNTATIENEIENDNAKAVSANDVHLDILNSEKEPKGSISCRRLYEILQENAVNLLIMDTRTTEDYAASRLSDHKCISVPAEIIKPGATGPKLETNLPPSSLKLWRKRDEVDVIVLLDWSSSVSKPPLGKEIETLKRAIYEFDALTVLKSEPLVLSGGYEEWLNYYPTCTTNSHVQRPKPISGVSTDAIFLNIDYPDFDKAFIASPSDLSDDSSNIFILKPEIVNNLQTNNKLATDLKERETPPNSTFPSIDRTTKPKERSIPFQSANGDLDSSKRVDSGLGHNLLGGFRPFFDRGVKPKFGSWRSTEDDRNQVFKDAVIRDKELTDACLQLERDTLRSEQEIDRLRLQREKEAEEGMRLELQKQETILLDRIDQMDRKQKQIGAEKDLLDGENRQLKLQIEELTKNDEENKWVKEEFRKIKQKREEKLKLEQEVNRIRSERNKKDATVSKTSKAMDVEQHSPNVSPSTSPKFSRHHSGTHQLEDGIDRSFVKLNVKESQSNRDSFVTRGLSRSQSFPNLSQILDGSMSQSSDESSQIADASLRSSNSSRTDFSTPLVNRGVKPSAAELIAASSRNLMPVFGGQGRGVTGLKNIGNSCYMNSIIQCLSNTTPLAEYFVTRKYKQDINRNLNMVNRNYPGELVEEFAAIVLALQSGQNRFISPRDLKNVISNYRKAFANCEQQDAQELLMVLVDCLHEELNKGNKNKAQGLEKELQSLENSAMPVATISRKAWDVEKLRNDSIFVELFQGQYVSTLTCCYCNKVSVKFDTFSCLTLPIPHGVNNCNLKDCLQLFSKEEMMTGSSKWKCPRCKEPRDAKKKMDIYRLPRILTVHLKRFSYEGLWRKKLETNVDFPLTGLNTSDYVRGPDKRQNFDLYAVTNHYGTLEGGHYISFCKNVYYNKWFKFDDHEVMEIATSKIKSSAAYLLFYTCYNSGNSG